MLKMIRSQVHQLVPLQIYTSLFLAFLSGTGEAVLCDIIFKSKQNVSEIPLSWKLGVDITVADVNNKTW
jgi:hypothetical protein